MVRFLDMHLRLDERDVSSVDFGKHKQVKAIAVF